MSETTIIVESGTLAQIVIEQDDPELNTLIDVEPEVEAIEVVQVGPPGPPGEQGPQGEPGLGTISPPPVFVNSSTTVDSEARLYLVDAAGGPVTITLGPAVGRTGKEYVIKKVDISANEVIVASISGIDGFPSVNTNIPGDSLMVESSGDAWYVTTPPTGIGGDDAAQSISWADVQNKPAQFPPDLTSHLAASDPHPGYLTPAEADALYRAIGYVPSWAEITGKPTVFPPDLTDHLAASDPHPSYLTADEGNALYKAIGYVPSWGEVTGKPATFPSDPHDHDGRYYTETETETLLDAKADLVGGVVPTNQLPAFDPVDQVHQNVASEAAMLALSAIKGDLAIRTDFDPDRAYYLTAADPTVLANWVRVTFGDVVSVNGQTGVIVLAAADVGAAPASHDHDSRYYTESESDTRYKAIGYVPSWTEITDKPATFPPDLTSHLAASDPHPSYLTPSEADALYKAIGYVPSWTEITDKPSVFPPDLTSHLAASDPHPGYLTPAEANALYKAIGYVPDWTEITSKPSVFPPDLTDHIAASDPHTVYQRESEKGSANGYAGLDGSGKVPTAQLPGGTQYRNQVSLGSDVINNNAVANTLQDVTGLSFDVVAGVRYKFEAYIIYDSAATATGSRWALNGPALTRLFLITEYTLTATSTTRNIQSTYNGGATGATSILTGNLCLMQGIIECSAAGTVVVRFASETANVAITAKSGSSLEWWQ
jgi:hypothetical protein